jgi:hypothetical protein
VALAVCDSARQPCYREILFHFVAIDIPGIRLRSPCLRAVYVRVQSREPWEVVSSVGVAFRAPTKDQLKRDADGLHERGANGTHTAARSVSRNGSASDGNGTANAAFRRQRNCGQSNTRDMGGSQFGDLAEWCGSHRPTCSPVGLAAFPACPHRASINIGKPLVEAGSKIDSALYIGL